PGVRGLRAPDRRRGRLARRPPLRRGGGPHLRRPRPVAGLDRAPLGRGGAAARSFRRGPTREPFVRGPGTPGASPARRRTAGARLGAPGRVRDRTRRGATRTAVSGGRLT